MIDTNPFPLDDSNDHESFANASIPSILMTVLSYTDSLSLHSQLLECLMRLKPNIIQDLLCVIAYGTGKSRHAAVELLFQYWPGLNPSFADRKALTDKHVSWKPLTCQNDSCQNTLNNEAVKICFSQLETLRMGTNLEYKGRPPIPMLICIECAELVRAQTSSKSGTGLASKWTQQDILLNVLHPMTEICYTCESKNCTASKKNPVAVVTCFSLECTSFNSNKPVRLCAQCHQTRHSTTAIVEDGDIASVPGTSAQQNGQPRRQSSTTSARKHLIQEHLTSLWQLSLAAQQHFSEAIIALLREAAAAEKTSKDSDRYTRQTGGPGAGGGFGLPGGGGGGFSSFDRPYGMPGIDSSGGIPGGGFGSGVGSNPVGGGMSSPGTESGDSSIEERQLLSRYGIWMLVGLCDPSEANTTERKELLGRMLAMLCQWFHYTACLPDDQAGSALERLKGETIHGWLMKVIDSQFQLFANCLIPTPPEYAMIGGHWECWPSIDIHIKEGFKRLLCLVPYDMITADIWAYIMPYWMESFRYDLAEDELSELKINLSKVLDPDLSPLGLPPKQMYHFISICFERANPIDQEQALSWLQILTLLEIPVPINLLNSMFLTGIKSLVSDEKIIENMKLACASAVGLPNHAESFDLSKTDPPGTQERQASEDPPADNCEHASETAIHNVENVAEMRMSCFVLKLDILLKQFELQEINAHKGFDIGKDAINTTELLFEMVSLAKYSSGNHTCMVQTPISPEINLGPVAGASTEPTAPSAPATDNKLKKPNTFMNECLFCELCSVWYQLSLQLITYFAPLTEITVMPDISGAPHTDSADGPNVVSSFSGASGERAVLYSINEDIADMDHHSVGAYSLHSGTDHVDALSSDAQHFGANDATDGPGDGTQPQEVDDQHFSSVELSMTERLTMKFLREMELHRDPDVLYSLLQCLKLLTLHAGVLSKLAKDEKRQEFFVWLQQRYLIPNLWTLLQAEFSQVCSLWSFVGQIVSSNFLSQIAQISVPLLLHCIALPCGLSVITHLINKDFKNEDWCVRFAAIERVASFSQFLEQSTVKNSSSLQSALSSVFIHMIQSLDDINCAVAQRALLSLESMKGASLKLYVWCLEVQFDLVIVDRCLVLSSLLQLFNHLSHLGERRVLTWDFFLNRFDALFLEAQVFISRSENHPEISGEPTRDLRNTNVHSETYKKKISRAYEALAETHLKRSLLPHHGKSKSNTVRSHNSFSMFQHTQPSTSLLGTSHSHSSGGKLNKFHQKIEKFKSGSSGVSASSVAATASGAQINRKSSKLAALTGSAFPNNFFHEAGSNKRDNLQEELHLFNVIHQTLEEDFADNETVHLLVFLFMQFMSWSDTQHPVDDKNLTRTQIIVLRHINTLVGYSSTENQFFLSAFDLRKKSIFSAFLSALPDVLDQNLVVGSLLLPTVFPLMIFCPAGHRFNYTSDMDSLSPNYSLWLLQPHLRQSWLSSLVVILYKHNYGQTTPYGKFIHLLVQIVMNTLESALEHRCTPTEAFLRKTKGKLANFQYDILTITHYLDIKEVYSFLDTTDTGAKTESISEEVVNKPSSNKQQTVKDAVLSSAVDETTQAVIEQICNGVNQPNLPKSPETTSSKAACNLDSVVVQVDPIAPTRSILKTTIDNDRIEPTHEAHLPECHALKCKLSSQAQFPTECNIQTESVAIADSMITESSSQSQINDMDEGEACNSSSVFSSPPLSANNTINITPIPPQIERLLPIGGELAEPVQQVLQRRPYPSVLGSGTGVSSQRSLPPSCCCCCGASVCTECCNDYNKTLETLKQTLQHSRDLSQERLLPIGPQPRSQSRSMERKQKEQHDNLDNEFTDNYRAKLKRQHTTIVPAVASEAVSSKTKDAPVIKLSPSKSFDSVQEGDLVIPKKETKVPPPAKSNSTKNKPKASHNKPVGSKTDSTMSLTILEDRENLGKFSGSLSTSRQQLTSTSNNPSKQLNQRTVEELKRCMKDGVNVVATHKTNKKKTRSNEADKDECNMSDSSQKTCSASVPASAGSNIAKSSSTQSLPVAKTDAKSLKEGILNKKGGKKKSKKQKMKKNAAKSSKTSLVDSLGVNVDDSNVSAGANGDPNDPSSAYHDEADLENGKEARHAGSVGKNTDNNSSHSEQLANCGHELCLLCRMPIEKFDESELGLCLVALCTFIHRDPSLAASVLPSILKTVSRYAIRTVYPWQLER